MGLRVLRFPNESWREAVARHGRKQALETEVLDEYDRNIKEGDPEEEAAFHALYEWDCCDYDPWPG